jgi:hypothetical protein
MNQKAVLRSGVVVILTGRSECASFPLIGKRFSGGALELWRRDGRWREDGSDHPLDVTHLVTPTGKTVEFMGLAP